MNIPRQLLSIRRFWYDLLVLAKEEVALKSTSIRFNGIRGEAQIPLQLQPTLGMLLLCKKWVAFPTDVFHDQLLPIRREHSFFFVLYWMSCIPHNIDENAARNILAKARGTVGHTGADSATG